MPSVLEPPAIAPLAVHAVLRANKLAVVDDRPDGTRLAWTFAELNREANRLAHVLADLGVKPGDCVAWCGPNSPGIVRATHARAKLGAVGVPINYRLTPAEAAYIVDNSDSVVVYVDAEHAQTFTSVRSAMPKVRHIVTFGGPPPPGALDGDALLASASDAEVTASDTGFVSLIYTSGTTGRPKGALRGAADLAQTRALLELVGHVPDDVYLTTGPLYHSGPGGYLGVAHTLGNTAVLQRRFDAEDWLRLVETYKVSMTFAAPTPIRLVCNLPAEIKARYDRSSMRRMIANAAPWSFALKEAYMADFGEDSLWEIYGSTELSVNTVLAPQDQRRKPGACGRPAPGVEIRLYDERGEEVTEPGVPGEVYIRSVSNFTTYYKADDRAAEARRGDFATVGDIAYRDPEGFLYICDRKNDMIISGGMNVYPAEIEAALELHPGVVEAAVFGIPDDQWGERVHAVVVPRAGHAITPDDVTTFARQHLAGYKVPRSVSFLAELPHTGSGKILKRELREPFWQGRTTRV
ncbi:MAG TPA: AMP-binding protein [Chloroflexota bacterium]|nr:AMP-binding protein [Chloroflexota bacterium]